MAQELRFLAHSEINSCNLYGSDVIASYLSTSYELFNDREHFKGTLVPANIFSETLFEKEFLGWENKFKIVHAGLFLHLFGWEQQVIICQQVVKLLDLDKGSLFLGEMAGFQGGGERGEGKDSKFLGKGEKRRQYLHDEQTFKKMWKESVRKSGIQSSQWKIEVDFRLRTRDNDGEGSRSRAFFTGDGIGWLTFCVERV